MEKKPITRAQVEEIIDSLQGTCNDLEDVILQVCGDHYDRLDFSKENHEQLDDAVFECAECGWWYETCEESESNPASERICVDCHPDDEDDD